METIIAALKAIPRIVDLVDRFVDLWLTYQEGRIDQEYDIKKGKRIALAAALKAAKDDETRKAIAREINDLSKI